MTIVATLPAGWAADRFGRFPLMVAGAVLSALGTLLLIFANSSLHILVFGSLMSMGTAAFTSANWALTADIVPPDRAGQFFGLANFGTAGAAAFAGLFGPLIDAANALSPGAGYPVLFVFASIAFLGSGLVIHTISRTQGLPGPGTLEVVLGEIEQSQD